MTPKPLSNRKKALLPFALLAVIIGIFALMGGCETDFDKVKLNRDAVQEYNRSIEQFNKFSHAFTKLGQKVNAAGEDKTKTDEAFWKKVQELEEPVRKQAKALRDFQFKRQEFVSVNDEIFPLLDEADSYMEQLEALRESAAESIDPENHDKLKTLYLSILDRSGSVVNTYDILYMEFVTKSKQE